MSTMSSLLRHGQNRRRDSSSSPTFAREACNKPLHADSHHIFGLPSEPVSQLPTLNMNLSMSSNNSNHSMSDKMNASSSSVGLPSSYPTMRGDFSLSSLAVEEELADFNLFDDETNTQESSPRTSLSSSFDETPLEDLSPTSSPSREEVSKSRKRLHTHRRQPTLVGSVEDFSEITAPSRSHRRRRNHALGPKDFHETVLTELFEDVSLTEFTY